MYWNKMHNSDPSMACFSFIKKTLNWVLFYFLKTFTTVGINFISLEIVLNAVEIKYKLRREQALSPAFYSGEIFLIQ